MQPESETPEAMFRRSLHVSEALAKALVSGGLTTLDEVAYVPHWELAKVSGLNEHEVTELRNLARMYLVNDALEGPNGAIDG